VRALAGRAVLERQVDAALSACDALVLPTLPIPAPLLGANTIRVGTSDQSVRNVMLRLTQLFNLTGHPAVSIPCGRTADGLPCGLQIVGPRGRTEDLLGVAAALEPLLPATTAA
jgi:Asp-tRNA(Asn)/Glu-tRNA(Gln) amidotransferase A subunit family amidase